MRKLTALRRLSQFFFLLLFVYILWSTTYPLTGKLAPRLFFVIDPFVMLITALSQRIFLAGFVFSLAMIGLTGVLGRFFCGWICPLGTLIDAAGAVRKKHRTISDSANKKLRQLKFFFLAAVVLLALFGIQAAWIGDPIVVLGRFISLNFIPFVTRSLDSAFIFFIRTFHWYGAPYDFYRNAKASWLGIHPYYFSHSITALSSFLLIIAAALFLRRVWCRILCPLGALYALCARFGFLERVITECKHCRKCKSDCRMGAIKDDGSYVKGECVLCMDCVYDCPQNATAFVFLPGRRRLAEGKQQGSNKADKGGISRRNFLLLAAVSLFSFAGKKNQPVNFLKGNDKRIIRPPAALREDEFVDRCIRCGNCMKVCITNGLQPVLFEAGPSGVWTPQLVPAIGYCEYHCTLCGQTCPTGAIKALNIEEKKKTKLGLARIDKALCLPWSRNEQCIVCEEHCPIPQKAIKFVSEEINDKIIQKPYIDRALCVGCGICENKCPVRPARAIRVYALQEEEGL